MKFKRVIFPFCGFRLSMSGPWVWTVGALQGQRAAPHRFSSHAHNKTAQLTASLHTTSSAHTTRPAHNILKEHSQSTFEYTHDCTVCNTYNIWRGMLTCTQARQWRTFECRRVEDCLAQINTNTS